MDALSNSEGVFQQYNSAQKSFRDRLEVKKYEHLGNDSFSRDIIERSKMKNAASDAQDAVGKTSSFIDQSKPKRQHFLVRPKVLNDSFKTLNYENSSAPPKVQPAASGKFINKKVLEKILQRREAEKSIEAAVDRVQLR